MINLSPGLVSIRLFPLLKTLFFFFFPLINSFGECCMERRDEFRLLSLSLSLSPILPFFLPLFLDAISVPHMLHSTISVGVCTASRLSLSPAHGLHALPSLIVSRLQFLDSLSLLFLVLHNQYSLSIYGNCQILMSVNHRPSPLPDV